VTFTEKGKANQYSPGKGEHHSNYSEGENIGKNQTKKNYP
jgi:hypothetical protein